MIDLGPALSLAAISLSCMCMYWWNCRTQRDPRLGFLSPNSTFAVAVFIKTVVGGGLVFALGSINLPSGEFGQYVITFRYMGDVLRIWAVLITSCVTFIGLLRLLNSYFGKRIWSPEVKRSAMGKRRSGVRESIREDLKALFKNELDGESLRAFESFVYILGFVWIGFFVLGITSGSLERGLGYDEVAARIWRLTDAFVVFSRLKVVYYYLCGLLITNSKCRNRLRYLLQLVLLFGLAILTGGRGEVFYGVAVIIVALASKRDSIRRYYPILIALAVGVLLYIPFMGAVRETAIYKETSISRPTERIVAIAKSAVDVEGLKYRVSTLGREVYACSDAFLFHPDNLNTDRVGFGDLSIAKVGTLLLPKAFHGFAIEKLDGSRIAQELMGVRFNRTWYPCISTPGDIYRRSTELGLLYGGCAIGVILVIGDAAWKRILDMGTSWGSILLAVLPISFIQLLPFGTVQETIWMWGWDLPKYVAISFLLSIIHRSRFLRQD